MQDRTVCDVLVLQFKIVQYVMQTKYACDITLVKRSGVVTTPSPTQHTHSNCKATTPGKTWLKWNITYLIVKDPELHALAAGSNQF